MTSVASTQHLTVTRMAGGCGALVEGVDLAQGCDDATFVAIHQALLDHGVICLRGQDAVTPEQHIDFGRRWGVLEPHPYVPPIDGYPEIMEVYDPNPITTTWHADFTYAKRPPGVSILLARIIPEVGGDTMFANVAMAYDGLSEGMQQTLLGLRAVHYATQLAVEMGLPEEDRQRSHPVVRTHPATGRKGLFVNDNYVKHFEGWTERESLPLLDFLYGEIGRFEYTYRHHWAQGDMLIWDNCAVQHAVVGDTAGAKRSLHRVTIEGDEPV
jgi:taurine dioxygenase